MWRKLAWVVGVLLSCGGSLTSHAALIQPVERVVELYAYTRTPSRLCEDQRADATPGGRVTLVASAEDYEYHPLLPLSCSVRVNTTVEDAYVGVVMSARGSEFERWTSSGWAGGNATVRAVFDLTAAAPFQIRMHCSPVSFGQYCGVTLVHDGKVVWSVPYQMRNEILRSEVVDLAAGRYELEARFQNGVNYTSSEIATPAGGLSIHMEAVPEPITALYPLALFMLLGRRSRR